MFKLRNGLNFLKWYIYKLEYDGTIKINEGDLYGFILIETVKLEEQSIGKGRWYATICERGQENIQINAYILTHISMCTYPQMLISFLKEVLEGKLNINLSVQEGVIRVQAQNQNQKFLSIFLYSFIFLEKNFKHSKNLT